MNFSNGQIDIWMKNPNLNINNAADMPLCLAAILSSVAFENDAPVTDQTPRWSEFEVLQNASEASNRYYSNLMKMVRKMLLRYVIHCQKCRRDISLVVIRKKPT